MSEDKFVKLQNGYYYFGETADERWIASESEGITYNYLIYTCPTMKDAIVKLRAIRKAALQVQMEEAKRVKAEALARRAERTVVRDLDV